MVACQGGPVRLSSVYGRTKYSLWAKASVYTDTQGLRICGHLHRVCVSDFYLCRCTWRWVYACSIFVCACVCIHARRVCTFVGICIVCISDFYLCRCTRKCVYARSMLVRICMCAYDPNAFACVCMYSMSASMCICTV